jgi:hypothetical protein
MLKANIKKIEHFYVPTYTGRYCPKTTGQYFVRLRVISEKKNIVVK